MPALVNRADATESGIPRRGPKIDRHGEVGEGGWGSPARRALVMNGEGRETGKGGVLPGALPHPDILGGHSRHGREREAGASASTPHQRP
jgi:hypothetical protein